MLYTVSANGFDAKQTTDKEILSVLENISLILKTRKGTVPQYRDFGVEMEFLDKPIPVAKSLMIAPVREAVEQWETRATVKNIYFDEKASNGTTGKLCPIVEVEIALD